MKSGIQPRLAGLSLSDSISISLSAQRCRTTVHSWVLKADRQPTDGASPNRAAVDGLRFGPTTGATGCPARSPATNRLLHVRLSPTGARALTEMFLAEPRETHLTDDATFPVDGAPRLQAALHRRGRSISADTHGNRNSVGRAFERLKRRTTGFTNRFRRAEPATAETWLQAFAACWNRLTPHLARIDAETAA